MDTLRGSLQWLVLVSDGGNYNSCSSTVRNIALADKLRGVIGKNGSGGDEKDGYENDFVQLSSMEMMGGIMKNILSLVKRRLSFRVAVTRGLDCSPYDSLAYRKELSISDSQEPGLRRGR